MKEGCKKTHYIAQRTIKLSQRKEYLDLGDCEATPLPVDDLQSFLHQVKAGVNPESVHCCPLLTKDKLFLQSSTPLERLVLFNVYIHRQSMVCCAVWVDMQGYYVSLMR